MSPRKCSATGKSCFETKGDALTQMRKLKFAVRHCHHKGKRIKHRMGKPVLKRAYFCFHCKGWHLTSKEQRTTHGVVQENKHFKRKAKDLIVTKDRVQDWKKDSLPFPDKP